MDEKSEAFRDEVLQWRGTRKKGAKPYTAEMKATALQFAKRLQRKGAAMDVVAKRLGIAATWPEDSLIHHGCSVPARPLPVCSAGAKGEAWSTVSSSSDLKGNVVWVRDRLLVGPLDREQNRRSRPIVVGEGDNPLHLFGSRGRFSCTGDESRLCCLAPAKEGRWFIQDAEVCQVPGRD